MPWKIWVNAGELSGDIQGAALLAALREEAAQKGIGAVQAIGMGGDHLAAQGMENMFHVSDLSVMGITEVLQFLPRIIQMLSRTYKYLKTEKPDAIVLIDAAEYNFQIARMGRLLGIPVHYFIPPKIWAWRAYRVHFLKKHCQTILSILPFEQEYYAARTVQNLVYVGNPLVDLVDYPSLEAEPVIPTRIGLMPGSRKKEVEGLLPEFSKAADILYAKFPQLTFHVIRAPHLTEEYLRSLWQSAAPFSVENPENRYAFIHSCQCLIAASGTATLESGLCGTPTVVAYKVNPLSYAAAQVLVGVEYVSLTNLILKEELFPELLQEKANAFSLAATLQLWLENPAELARIRGKLNELRALCGKKGSASRAAGALLAH